MQNFLFRVWPTALGLLAGGDNQNVKSAHVLFASKESLREPQTLSDFPRNYFDYIIIGHGIIALSWFVKFPTKLHTIT
jgi:hypothetical protein